MRYDGGGADLIPGMGEVQPQVKAAKPAAKGKKPVKKGARRPAEVLPVARVAVDVSLPHLDRPFDYLVPVELDAKAVSGCRVRVRFAGQLVDGFLLERVEESAHTGRLAYLERVTSPEPVLTPEVAALVREVADRYAGTFADVLRLAVPPRHARAESAAAPPPWSGDIDAGEPGPWADYPAGESFLAALAGGRDPRAIWTALPGPDWPAAIARAARATLASGRGVLIVMADGRDVSRIDQALTTELDPPPTPLSPRNAAPAVPSTSPPAAEPAPLGPPGAAPAAPATEDPAVMAPSEVVPAVPPAGDPATAPPAAGPPRSVAPAVPSASLPAAQLGSEPAPLGLPGAAPAASAMEDPAVMAPSEVVPAVSPAGDPATAAPVADPSRSVASAVPSTSPPAAQPAPVGPSGVAPAAPAAEDPAVMAPSEVVPVVPPAGDPATAPPAVGPPRSVASAVPSASLPAAQLAAEPAPLGPSELGPASSSAGDPVVEAASVGGSIAAGPSVAVSVESASSAGTALGADGPAAGVVPPTEGSPLTGGGSPSVVTRAAGLGLPGGGPAAGASGVGAPSAAGSSAGPGEVPDGGGAFAVDLGTDALSAGAGLTVDGPAAEEAAGVVAPMEGSPPTGGGGGRVVGESGADVSVEGPKGAAGGGVHVALTAELGPAERYRRWLAVLRGAARVVVGTRAAMFAPVRDLGLVVLWDDGDDVHAEPHAPYPHAREVLALRAHRAGAGALIGGFTRTPESTQLVESGWAHALVADRPKLRQVMPRVRPAGDDAELSRDEAARSARLPNLAFRVARQALAEGPVLVQVPRRGYLPALACSRCRGAARCGACQGPLSLTSSHAAPYCRWCGRIAGDWSCPHCGNRHVRAVVVGARRTAEELGRSFPGVTVRTSGRDGVLDRVGAERALIVATPGAEPVADEGYAAALLLDGWVLLGRADLRSSEEALRRWMDAAALVRTAAPVVVLAEGTLAPVQALLRWDPVTHAERELGDRRELGFPPTVRMASLTGTPAAIRDLLNDARLPDGAEVLGPVPVPGRDGDQDVQQRALVRVSRAAGLALSHALKAAQGVRSARKAPDPVRIQIDPLELI